VSVPIFTDIPSEYIFQSEEVYNLLSHVKTRKSSGPDEIPNWFLKEFAFAIADPVCHIFNAFFSSGLVPDIWKRANVIPRFQNQTHRNPFVMTFDPFRLLRP